ncbi:MAG: tRNA glutamyl-Q(34) synthetase GluQRS [Polyangiaceae bacterium]
MNIRTRFAPSPTGDLHVGGAWTAIASHALGGVRILRVEDIDTPRTVPGSADRIAADLAWLGLRFDEGPSEGGPFGPYVQSERFDRYDAALRKLDALGLVYPCDCSRTEIARVASAPHAGEELVYPGTCRDKSPKRDMRRKPALRLRVPEGTVVRFIDEVRGGGTVAQHVDRDVGDFVLRRGDGIYAYQLAVSVDDAEMGITHVVRGRDLLGSTARQRLLMTLLGGHVTEHYTHVPMVLDADGARLEKRTKGATIASLREAGLSPDEVVRVLAEGLGFTWGTATSGTAFRTTPFTLPPAWSNVRTR